MNLLFYLAGAVAVAATVMVITRLNAVHALLYLIVSLLSVALVFALLGAPFVAALEVIVYAGAIMMLFVFAVMMLNLGPRAAIQERLWLPPRAWVLPAVVGVALLLELVLVVAGGGGPEAGRLILPKAVGAALFGPDLIGVELAGLLLFAGLIGAFYLGQRYGRREG